MIRTAGEFPGGFLITEKTAVDHSTAVRVIHY